jgi:hypothetical protein
MILRVPWSRPLAKAIKLQQTTKRESANWQLTVCLLAFTGEPRRAVGLLFACYDKRCLLRWQRDSIELDEQQM